MTKLKPCPFCGGKVKVSEREGYSGGEYITEIECNVCHMHVENLYNNDKTIDLWNTRQPAFDWKPIEELSLSLLKEGKKIVLYNKKRPFTDEYDFICEDTYEEYSEDLQQLLDYVKNDCSYYALLTPPDKE